MDKTVRKLCDCGCGSRVPNPPYESGGKQYASAWCIIKEAQICYMCGGYDGKDPDKIAKADYVCHCNWSALDGSE